MSKRGVLLFVLSLAAGMVAGGLGKPKAALAVPEAPAPSPREKQGPKDKWQLDDFLAAARQQKNPPGLGGELVLWSEDELRAALDECVHTPTGALLEARYGIQGELFHEWMKRNPDAALAWFEAIDPSSLKKRVVDNVARCWPAEKAEEGFTYLLSNRELLREKETLFQHRLIAARAKDGPDAVYAALQQFRSEGLTELTGEFTLPDGFDYAALLARDVDALFAGKLRVGEDGRGSLEWGFIQGWYQQNREAAFDWLLHEKGAARLNWIWKISGDEEQLQWLPKKIAALSGEQQDDFLTAGREGWLHDIRSLKIFANATKDPALLEKVQTLAVEGVVYSNIEQTMEIIGTNPDLERRLAMLEESPIGPSPLRAGSFFYGGTADYLRKTLGEWGAESSRIEAIIARFSKYEPPTQ